MKFLNVLRIIGVGDSLYTDSMWQMQSPRSQKKVKLCFFSKIKAVIVAGLEICNRVLVRKASCMETGYQSKAVQSSL